TFSRTVERACRGLLKGLHVLRRWTHLRLTGLAAAAGLLAVACGGNGGGDDASAGAGGELRVNITEPEHLIPSNTNESEGSTVLQALFTQLISYDENGDHIPRVANSIETEDAIPWSITLNEGWTFHNGEPVNADAFIRAWNFGAYGPNAQGNSYFFDRIAGYDEMQYKPEELDEEGEPIEGAKDPEVKELAGLEKTGEYSFDVTLKDPFASLDLMLGYAAFSPMAEECLADIKACEEAPIGNGPFRIDGKW